MERSNTTFYCKFISDLHQEFFNLKAPEGWVYFLAREKEKEKEIDENIDTTRISELKRKGWNPVPADRYPDLEDFHKDGCIKHRGLILLEIQKTVYDTQKLILDSKSEKERNEVVERMQKGLDDYSRKLDIQDGLNEKRRSRYLFICKESKLKWFIRQIISHFKRKDRHSYDIGRRRRYYCYGDGAYPISLYFVKTRKFIETLQFKFRFGKYKLDEEEKEVCKSLEVSEESYIQEKYKIEMSNIV